MHSTTVRSRNYVFTLNNYTKEEVRLLKESIELNKYLFICWGKEVGESGTPHLQGYVENKNARTIQALKKDPGFGRAHFEERKGTKLEAATYALKEGLGKILHELNVENAKAAAEENDTEFKMPEKPNEDITLLWARDHENHKTWLYQLKRPDYKGPCVFAGNWEHGLRPGTRNDINTARDIITKGGGMRDVLEAVNSYQGARMAQLMLNYTRPSRRHKTCVVWLWGPTGTGKTEIPWLFCSMMNTVPWVSSNNLTWFDGYDREKVAIIDDFRGDQSKLSWALRVFDKYPLMVPIKGSFCDWCPKVLFITSCYSPTDCYHNSSEENLDQLTRRITMCIHTQKVAPECVANVNDDIVNSIMDRMIDIDLNINGGDM